MAGLFPTLEISILYEGLTVEFEVNLFFQAKLIILAYFQKSNDSDFENKIRHFYIFSHEIFYSMEIVM